VTITYVVHNIDVFSVPLTQESIDRKWTKVCAECWYSYGQYGQLSNLWSLVGRKYMIVSFLLVCSQDKRTHFGVGQQCNSWHNR